MYVGAGNIMIESLSFMHSHLSPCRHPGADPGEVKWVNFHPPFSEPPLFFLIPQILK